MGNELKNAFNEYKRALEEARQASVRYYILREQERRSLIRTIENNPELISRKDIILSKFDQEYPKDLLQVPRKTTAKKESLEKQERKGAELPSFMTQEQVKTHQTRDAQLPPGVVDISQEHAKKVDLYVTEEQRRRERELKVPSTFMTEEQLQQQKQQREIELPIGFEDYSPKRR